jgi:hypothetical protein
MKCEEMKVWDLSTPPRLWFAAVFAVVLGWRSPGPGVVSSIFCSSSDFSAQPQIQMKKENRRRSKENTSQRNAKKQKRNDIQRG